MNSVYLPLTRHAHLHQLPVVLLLGIRQTGKTSLVRGLLSQPGATGARLAQAASCPVPSPSRAPQTCGPAPAACPAFVPAPRTKRGRLSFISLT